MTETAVCKLHILKVRLNRTSIFFLLCFIFCSDRWKVPFLFFVVYLHFIFLNSKLYVFPFLRIPNVSCEEVDNFLCYISTLRYKGHLFILIIPFQNSQASGIIFLVHTLLRLTLLHLSSRYILQCLP